MKLSNKYGLDDEFVCELTEELDSLAGIEKTDLFHHYILFGTTEISDRRPLIRVAGGTLGGMDINEDNVIISIHVSTDYIVRSYPENVNEILQKYIGTKLEF